MSATTVVDNRSLTQRPLAPGDEPRLAAHLVSPRSCFTHHGVYVGAGRVIHYAGLAQGLRRWAVEEVSLEDFAHGRGIWVRSATPDDFEAEQVVARARSRLGEHRYRILSNNCEHFCEWCLRGESRSAQVEALRARPRRALGAAHSAASRVLLEVISAGRLKALRPLSLQIKVGHALRRYLNADRILTVS